MSAKYVKRPKRCQLCGGKVEFVDNSKIYGRPCGSGKAYLCTECGAYTGTHKQKPTKALGILADAELRALKVKCHNVFDPFWNGEKAFASRYKCYCRLAKELGIKLEDCHFGHFDKETLNRAFELVSQWKKD